MRCVLLLVGFLTLSAHAEVTCDGNCVGDLDGVPISVGSNGNGDGTLAITDGRISRPLGASFSAVEVGILGSDTGTLNVSGATTGLTIEGDAGLLYVGSFGGVGNVRIDQGAEFVFQDNDVSPDDASTGIFLGTGGTATMDILSGATVRVIADASTTSNFVNQGFFVIGISSTRGAGNAQGTGTLNVDGVGTTLNVTAMGGLAGLSIGASNKDFAGTAPGIGVVNVTGGAKVVLDGTVTGTDLGGFLSLGRGARSHGTVLVDGVGSSITVQGGGGGAVYAGNDFENAAGDGIANITVTNQGLLEVRSETSAGLFAVGLQSGHATLLVDDGGTVAIEGLLNISTNGLADLLGSDPDPAGSQTGVVTVNGAGMIGASAGILVGSGTGDTVNGTLGGTGRVTGDVTVRRGGRLGAGLSGGGLTIDGDLTFAEGSVYRVEIRGPDATDFDSIDVTGSADLSAATLVFAFIDGYQPTAGTSLDVIFANTLIGIDLARINVEGLPDNRVFSLFENAGAVRLGIASTNRAGALDVDGNGRIEALSDVLMILRSGFGFSGDAVTDGAVGSDCTRCDADTVGSYLESLFP